jgi:aspartate oxidase
MKKARSGFLMAAAAGVAAASIWQAVPVSAEQAAPAAAEERGAEQEGEGGHHERHRIQMSKKDFEAHRLKKLQEMAEYFGIKTEGKSAQQLKDELAVAKEANKEKWAAFKAEHRAKRLEHLQKIAEKHGIKTDGKTEEQLREELMKVHGGKEHRRWKIRREESQDGAAAPKESPSANAVPAPTQEKHT